MLIKERFTFTLPPVLVKKVDKVRETLQINRSMVVREALSHWLEHRIQDEDIEASGLAIFSYIFDHHEQGVVNCLVKIRHDFEEELSSSFNFHISHHRRIEICICKGDFDQLKQLANRIRQIKGIESFSENYFQ